MAIHILVCRMLDFPVWISKFSLVPITTLTSLSCIFYPLESLF